MRDVTKSAIDYDEGKLIELILYVAAKCDLDPDFGAVKLNKILFYSDFEAYEKLGKPITGVEYRNYPNGPAPAPMKVLKHRLEESGDAYEYHNPLPHSPGWKQKRLLAGRAPDITRFSQAEVSLVDSVIARFAGRNGSQLSDLSHDHPGWRLSVEGEAIPYCTAFIADPNEMELTDEEVVWVRSVVSRVQAERAAA